MRKVYDLLSYELDRLAVKQLRKFKKTDKKLYEKIEQMITAIRLDPLIGEPKNGDLKGYRCVDFTHLKTEYRICYTIEKNADGQLILIIMIGTRENFYKEVKRYLNL